MFGNLINLNIELYFSAKSLNCKMILIFSQKPRLRLAKIASYSDSIGLLVVDHHQPYGKYSLYL